MTKAFILSNDLVPGFGCPVAAPGLRALGLYQGLKANGVDARIIVKKSTYKQQILRWAEMDVCAPPASVDVVPDGQLMDFIGARAPATVVLINSSNADMVEPCANIRFVLDVFSPQVLEHWYHSGDAAKIEDLIRRQTRAINLADGYIVNGAKKIPYVLGALAQCGKNVRTVSLFNVNMCLEADFAPDRNSPSDRLNLLIGGYQQKWAQLDRLIETLTELVVDLPLSMTVVSASRYWRAQAADPSFEMMMEAASVKPNVRVLPPMPFDHFSAVMHECDVSIDLFERNAERELAMVTRTAVALTRGLPVIHSDFTELSPLISAYGAGWCLEDAGKDRLRALFEQITGPDAPFHEKAQNARKLAADHFSPARELAKAIHFFR